MIIPGTFTYWKGRKHTNTKGRKRGGLAIIIKDNASKNHDIFTPKEQCEDILWLKLYTDDETVYIAVIYSRPNHIEEHEQIMSTISKNISEIGHNKTIYLTGDFNAKVYEIGKTTNTYAEAFRQMIAENNLQLQKTKPGSNSKELFTRIHVAITKKTVSNAVLDHIVTTRQKKK